MNAPGTRMAALSSIPVPGSSVSARTWVLLGCGLQLAVFAFDAWTPLGFAHGVLYAPAVVAGMLARRVRAIWLLAALGLAG
ncbi:MAG TPA: hypothetical protein VL251_08415, partial [Thermomonas sp.]|nr:hypothetical protein [Thermomonas sp.]